ncbi:MAG: DUF2203 domain-containing protein [Acidobacteria bacterium]|nr:DUF2203 domain-containing protein [Acidobacteriota bacterium]MDA1233266.1 DUF2203 domain-containing protein [Acidobacteriota bacterium]
MPRFFTLQEAEELLPRIERLLQSAVEAHSEAAGHEGALERVVSRITYLGGVEIDPADYSQRKNLKRRAEGVVQQAIEEIQAAGVLIKDIEVGLIDFPAIFGGREVLLCWKLGESKIEHWHGVDEGFNGRKPITGEFGPRASARPN